MVCLNPHDPADHRGDVTSFLDPLISFVSAHAWLAYLTLFLAALLEAVPVVGSHDVSSRRTGSVRSLMAFLDSRLRSNRSAPPSAAPVSWIVW